MKFTRSWTLLLTVVALSLGATAAWAAETEESDADTVFNFGYDEENKVFVWGTSSLDSVLDCRILAGTYQTKYVDVSGRFWVDDLLDDSAEPVTFPIRDDATAEPIPYAVDGECALSGGVVSGPNGQVNHGMFMKLFNALYDGSGRGCLVRHLARSGLGKGDQPIRVPEVGDQVLTTPESGRMDIESVLTRCGLSDDGDTEETADDRAERAGKGKPPWAGQSGGNGKGKPPWAGQPGGPKGNGRGGR